MLQPRDLKGRRAISYARWSSERQGAGDSLRRQTEDAERFCATNGLTLDHQLIDDGVSAFKGANLEASLGRFVEGVKAGTIPSDTVLLVEALDRVSRVNHMEALEYFGGLLRTGVTVVTLMDQRVHTLEDYRNNVASVMMSLMAMSAAHDYSAKISQRVRASWDGRAQKARHGRVRISKVPFWIDQQTQELHTRADDARLIFRLASEGMGQNGITQHLNLAGIPSSRGGQWGKSMVQDVLRSKAAYGSMVVKGEEVRDYFPPIITETEWLAIQHRTRMRAYNPQAGNTATLFPRLVHCAHCGSVMNVSTSRFGKWRYMICQGKTTKRTDCTAPNWRYDTFEREFIDRIGFLAAPITAAPREDRTAEMADAIRALEARQENILAGVAEAPDAATRAILLKQSNELTTKIEAQRRSMVEARELAARAAFAADATTDFTDDIEKMRVMAEENRAGAQRRIADLVERIELESESKELRRAIVTLRSGHQHSVVFGRVDHP